MALPQPKVLNFTSVITWVSGSTWMYIRMMSPHLALPTSPTPSASGSFPTFRGCWKWSITFSLYNAMVVVSFQIRCGRRPVSSSSHTGDMSRR